MMAGFGVPLVLAAEILAVEGAPTHRTLTFVPRDFHPLPFHQLAWRSKHPA